MADKFPCPYAGCTLLERHPGLCVFANLSDKRGRRDSTQKNTTASIVIAAQPTPPKRKLAPPPPAAPFDAACALVTSSRNDPATMLPPEVLSSSSSMDPNCIPFPDTERGGDEDADESGRAAGAVGTLFSFEDGYEAAVDGEAQIEGLAAAVHARDHATGPGQHRPRQKA